MKTTKDERDSVRASAEEDYRDREGGEVYCTVRAAMLVAILDDADRCAELEAEVENLRDALDGGKYGRGT